MTHAPLRSRSERFSMTRSEPRVSARAVSLRKTAWNARTKRSMRLRNALVSLALVCMPLGGCTFIWEGDSKPHKDLGVAPMTGGESTSLSHRDTIGALTYYQGMRTLSLRGFGVVVGLGQNGSTTCPKPAFEHVAQTLHKRHDFSSNVVGVPNIKPEDLLRDPDTAVVLVRGEVPPASCAGTTFDVTVTALPGTETSSLAGGRLYTAELETYRSTAPGMTLSGETLAKAAGPVFLNPFSEEGAVTEVSPLQGRVLGGGVVTQDRELRLVLVQPSYATARRIQERINDYFGTRERIANATSPSYVELRIPERFRDDAGHFLGLVGSLYLAQDATFEAVRARGLAQELRRPDSPHADIALCFEGLGRSAIPVLDELYGNEAPHVSFHAAVAGIRLGEHLACETMAAHAEDAMSPFRFQAIRGLGTTAHDSLAKQALRRLVSNEDPRVQIAAYEVLAKINDARIDTRHIGRDAFTLDLVSCHRPPFIYARRQGERRLALFGDPPRCKPPIFYRAPDGLITLRADAGDDEIRLVRAVPANGTVSPQIPALLELVELIELLGNDAEVTYGEVKGLGLDYGTVVRLLYHLCQDESLPAEFMIEQPNALELFGPPERAGRPESEL